jgi:alpha-glucoside transport system permease protein
MRPWSGFERLQGMLFVLPALVVLAIFLIYPAYYTVRLAFYEGDFHFGFFHYLGIDNFRQLLTNDPAFLDLSKFHGLNIIRELVYKNDGGALMNNLHWVIFYISLSIIIGLGLAVLAVRVRYERAVKTAIFVPMAISATAVGIIWLLVYNTDSNIGVLNAVWHGVLGQRSVSWLGDPSLVNYALIFAYLWASIGFVMVVLSAAIKGIPAEIMEAARVDGAGEWNIFRRIMLPMLSLPLSVVTIWLFINVIKVFDIIYVMTGGGPGTSSRVIAFTMYEETFHNGRPGYGAAVAVIMLVLVAPVMVLNVRRFRSEKVVA